MASASDYSPPQARTIDLGRLLIRASWGASVLLWLFLLTRQQFSPTWTWLLDWHVYAAGASDFLQGDLYYSSLESAYRLPISEFNYPPLSAILVIPLLSLPDAVGGTAWVVMNVVAMAAACILAARILGADRPALWGGIAFLAYTLHPWMRLAYLGNNTPLVLLLVTAFAHQHLRGRGRSAGALLGVAIAMKLWPVALLPILLRERRWESIGSAGIVVGTVMLGTLAWLGIGVIGPAFESIQARTIIESDNPVFLVSWLRETQDWWPEWGGYLVAGLLAAIPAQGLLGIGLGVFAGLALVPNLWRTYLPTFVFAALLVLKGLRTRASARREALVGVAAQDPSRRPVRPDLAP